MKLSRPRPCFRAVAAVLVPLQILVAIPADIFAADKPVGVQPPPAPKVKANRTLPEAAPPPAAPLFSEIPADIEFRRARIFEEPLVPVGGAFDAAENKALRDALTAYRSRTIAEDTWALLTFLEKHPQSRCRPVLFLNLGIAYFWSGYFTRALAAWDEVWELTKADQTGFGKPLADRAVGEIAAMNARVGRMDRLEELFEEIKERDVRGPAVVTLRGAREGLQKMKTRPEVAFRCGPYALGRIRATTGGSTDFEPKVLAAKSTTKGMSLTQVRGLARDMKMDYQAARRSPGAAVIVPAVAHWKLGHFAALVQEKDGRYLVQDPTFGDDLWVSTAALDDEGTGYFLVPAGTLPEGWQPVAGGEADGVWGKGHLANRDKRETKCDSPTAKEDGCGGSNGMATWDVHALLTSLTIRDTPVGYSPPVGPEVFFTVTYNQYEADQPAIFSYSNLGNKWNSSWLSFIVDSPGNPFGNAIAFLPGGGSESHGALDPASLTHKRPAGSKSLLKRVALNPPVYELEEMDGSKLVYGHGDGATAFPRRVFLTAVVDPQGNRATLTYDPNFRLVGIRDAIGQVTTLHYELPDDEYKVTKVTDPFGRSAHFIYSDSEPRQLVTIRDVIGIESRFSYGGGDFITSLTTPYGTTRFMTSGDDANTLYSSIEVIDPMGGRERVEYGEHGPRVLEPVLPGSIDMSEHDNVHLYDNNTYYWDKAAYAAAGYRNDRSKAKVTHWLAGTDENPMTGSGIVGSVKKPLEGRVFYFYDGAINPVLTGRTPLPTRITRVLSHDATAGTQVEEHHQYAYNEKQKVTRYTDPAGRETVYEYAPNGIDLTAIKQKNGATYDVLSSATYNGQHLPLTVTDASGKTTTLTYNAAGQLRTIETPAREGISEPRTTELTYEGGYLMSIAGPVAGATVAFTYDGYGRVRTITNADDYTVTLEYDGLDRPTKVYYPNGTYEEVVYDKLDVRRYRDLLGRWTEIATDALRRPTAVRDPSGRTTMLHWCDCGNLDRIIDGNGNATVFKRDTQGRVTEQLRADGSYIRTIYDTLTSRVSARRTERLLTRFTYNVDGTVAGIVYADPETGIADPNTPSLSFGYDPAFPRLATRTDGTGTTTYTYKPTGTSTGAGRLDTIEGPLPNSVVQYTYDELGRVRQRSVNGVPVTVTYDTLGRISNVTNPLGAFSYGYEENTGFLTSVTGPGGLTRTYDYFDLAGDRQLKQITNSFGSNVLSKFSYIYAPDNEIATWTQEVGGDPATAKRYTFGYDGSSQLTSAVLSKVADGTLLKSYAYAYDAAFNRTLEQIDSLAMADTHNRGNQLTSRQTAGTLTLEGTTNEPSTVAAGGAPAQSVNGAFRVRAPVTPGTNTVSLAVKDKSPSQNARTYTYEVGVSGGSATLTYDSAGNLLSDGSRTYEWDLTNRLLAINQGTHRTEFTYDGFSRRTRIVEKEAGAVASDKRYLWVGTQIAEERDATGANTLKRYFGQGVQQGGQNLYYTRDHLGSIREVVDSTGAVRARYDYDPYGRRTKLPGGDVDADFGYTGHFEHAASGLKLAMYRAYDANLGRWLSRDPIGLAGGVNVYAYVGNSPINYFDPLGLSGQSFAEGMGAGAVGVGIGLVVGGGIVAATAGTAAAPFVATGLVIAGIWSVAWGIGELVAAGLYGTIDEVDYQAGKMCVLGPAALAGGQGLRGRGPGLGAAPKANPAPAPAPDVPDANVVVRGGTTPPEPGTTFSGAHGETLPQAAAGVPHGQVQATTAGAIRKGGGNVELAPEPAYPGGPINNQHVNVTLGPKSQPFGPPAPNPVPKSCRVPGRPRT